MAYYYSNHKLTVSPSNWRANQIHTTSRHSNRFPPVTADSIRPPSVYVESDHDISNGHVVEWDAGKPTNFLSTGQRKTEWTADDGYEFAHSKVIPAGTHSNTVAGIVIEKAAEPGKNSFTHKGGAYTTQTLPSDSQHIYRVGRDIALAWVLDSHSNELEGIYTRYVNGVEDTTGPFQLTMTGNEHFSIERTVGATVEMELAELIARFDTLTT